MSDFDLQLANVFKSINQQNEYIQEKHVEDEASVIADDGYKKFIPQIEENKVRINNQNHTFEVSHFFDERIKLSLHKGNFKPLFDDEDTDKQIRMYNEQGSFFQISLYERPVLYKSLIFYKLNLFQYYQKINTPVTWIKLEKTDNLNYATFRVVAKDGPYYMVHFSGEIGDQMSFDGSFIVPEGRHEPWLDVYEASLHLLEINKEAE